MGENRVVTLPGVSEMISELREETVEGAVLMYRDKSGEWKFSRVNNDGDGVSVEEIGAATKLLFWLNGLNDRTTI